MIRTVRRIHLIAPASVALLVGGAAYLVGWFHKVGETVSAPPAVTQLVGPASPFLTV